MQKLPVVDFHCDLLSYLLHVQDMPALSYDALEQTDDIGASLPAMEAGKVKVQTCAIFTAPGEDSVVNAFRQARILFELFQRDFPFKKWKGKFRKKNITLIPAIEGASGLCLEEGDAEVQTEMNLLAMKQWIGTPLYVSMTHHGENRFGGGNKAQGIGLKEDGETLLEILSKYGICIDLSHSSYQLAEDIINYKEKNGLDLRVIASHSNFREVYEHDRNLTDEHAKYIIQNNGIIGITYLRDYMHKENPEYYLEHIEHGIKLGGENYLVQGADFFYWADYEPERHPLFFPELADSSKFPKVAKRIAKEFGADFAEKYMNKTGMKFLTENYIR
ncbi:membrane dipeptidase [Mangrovivirga sp. M17]|uniref:Membrane dipeptidase n=1 Tax=Mangrovivirga halotolerans TaxID=2993936 RepID=A0ABT3RSB5_9BACT|nr:membrane dipeptidase [Mangrovivirga halotolerans]MCX2744381.1 membrane dipeptidase [Mangrovivirga halotolerans]